MRAFGYVRLSQASDRSIASQVEAIRSVCRAQSWTLLEVFDEGPRSSGYRDDRPEYRRMLSLIEADADADLVMVRDMTRFGRTMKERLYQVLHLEQLGVRVYSVEKRAVVDVDNPQDLLLENVDAFADDVRKRAEIAKSKAELTRKRRLGHPVGRPPFGLAYSRDKSRFVPTERFEIAVAVLERRDRGESFPSIARALELPQTTVYRIWSHRDRYHDLEASRRRPSQ